jgi:hypothetical protein
LKPAIASSTLPVSRWMSAIPNSAAAAMSLLVLLVRVFL